MITDSPQTSLNAIQISMFLCQFLHKFNAMVLLKQVLKGIVVEVYEFFFLKPSKELLEAVQKFRFET
jgi:hypothetical protein